jgi:hypothetical protein
MKKLLFSFLLILAFSANTAFSQTKAMEASDVSLSVPELAAFHTIIAPMWHQAYPAKDIAALKALVPKIKDNMEKINGAKLSGILREKTEAWKNELVKFNTAAENYYKASAGEDGDALLLAAEKLHSAYEGMNRAIRPYIKEMDTFHQTLYVIYHKNLPEKNFTEVANVIDNLILQADAIVKFPQDKLEKRLKENTPKFYTYAGDLNAAVIDLKEVLKGNNAKKSEAAIEKVHTLYQKLETAFN